MKTQQTIEIRKSEGIDYPEIWNQGLMMRDITDDDENPDTHLIELESIRENFRNILRIIREGDRHIMTESIPMMITTDKDRTTISINIGGFNQEFDIYSRGDDDDILIDSLISILQRIPDLEISRLMGNLYLSLFSHWG